MSITRSSLAAILLSSVLAAQGFTSPAGYTTVEGSSNHDYILFRYNDLRWQQLDATSVGQAPTLIQRISWRRDGTTGADPTWIARTIDIGAVLSNSVVPGAISEGYAANYSGTPTNVFISRPVNLPDWTANLGSPAPFNLSLPLDLPWVYAGLEPFLWELNVTNNTSASDYGNDFQSITGSTATSTAGTSLGTGCIATGQTAAMSLAGTLKNQVTRFRLAYTVTRAPASTPVFMNIDFVNSNLPVPGLCANVIAVPTISFGVGISDIAGAVPELALENIPYSAALIGTALYSQALAPDFGQPVLPFALSNGRSHVFPNPAATPATVTRVYGYRLATGAMRAPSVWTGGIVTLFD
ncbi:MAG: hypothetical protein HZB39_21395 [Planctomycetes bacterium]|nr:hypothetical protein [Planctomycetota bacterium]